MSETAAGLKLELSALALDALTPYLSGVLRPQATGSMAVTGQLDWAAAAAPQAQRLKLTLEQLTLDAFKLGDPGTAATRQAREGTPMSPPGRPKGEYRSAQREGTPMSLARLELGASEVDLMARTATLASIRLQGAELRVERTSDGVWNVQRWAAAAAAAPAQVAAAEPWKLVLKSFALEGGKVQFIDAGARPAGGSKQGEPVRLDISQLKVGVQGLQLSGERTLGPAQVQLSARVASGGATRERGTPSGLVDWRGQFGVQPLLLRGTARIERLPVQALQAYFAQALNVSVLRADAGYRGGLTLQQAGSGFNHSAQGDALVSDVLVHSRPDAAGSDSATEELLSWQKLSLDGVTVAMRAGAAPKVEVREAALSDFYSRLILTEQGRFNLQEVAPAAAAAASAPASGASASAAPSASPTSGPPIDISIGATKLANGRIDFSDRFIRPNYSAALTELNGNLGAFRSGTREMATLELHGRAAGTALLEIIGQINPTAAPLALDIKAKATDLELAPLSPYAGKYAGYAIERGKLSMDVQYRIDPDGRLEAKNQVILNQLTFGDKIESASATKLPVRLAVALLTDRNGVIDINLPVSGSINDPQFSVGGIIIKVIINILTKAFTAPFALLAGGGSEDVSLVEFKPGTALFTDGGNSVVAKVAKALADRPALKMTVTGAADPASEREAFQRATLEQRLVQERRREQLRSSAAASAPDDALALDAADRARLLKEVYKQTELPDKPRNVIGLAKDIPAAEMETLLRNQVRVSVEAVRELALQRGLAVRDALIAKGLANERLFLAAPKLRVSGEDDAAWTPRVQLTLSTN